MEQPENSPFKFSTLSIFHSEISGRDFNNVHSEKIYSKYLTLLVSHLEILGNDLREEH